MPKTKAEATQAVMDAAHSGLDAVIVHPSGILGPYNGAKNYLVQLVNDYIGGKLPACVHGGYDFVGCPGVAEGMPAGGTEKAGRGSAIYCLTGMKSRVLKMAKALCGGKKYRRFRFGLRKRRFP